MKDRYRMYLTVLTPMQQAFRRARTRLRSASGAIDLASIMVGVLIVGIISGVISATVFSVIPWSQDQAAKQSVSAAETAQDVYRAKSLTPGAFGSYGELITAAVLPDSETLAVAPGATRDCFIAVAGSPTGKAFWASDADTAPKQYRIGDVSSCPGTDLASAAAAVIGAASNGASAVASRVGYAESLYRAAHGSYVTADVLTHTSDSGRPYLKLPAGATSAVFTTATAYCAAVSIDGDNTIAWQYAGLATPAVTKPSAADAGGATCAASSGPPVTNLLADPSFENGTTTGWVVTITNSMTSTTGTVHSGSKAVKITTNGSVVKEGIWSNLPQPAMDGKHYSAGVWLWAPAGSKFWVFLRLLQTTVDDDGAHQVITGTGGWQFVTINDRVAHAGETALQLMIRTSGEPGATPQAITYYVDDPIIVEGTKITGTGNGDYPGWVWNGAPHASTSTGLQQ